MVLKCVKNSFLGLSEDGIDKIIGIKKDLCHVFGFQKARF